MDGWETTFTLGQSAYVQVRLLLVSGRVPYMCINFDPSKNGSQFTPPKTNIVPLKIKGWKMYFLLKYTPEIQHGTWKWWFPIRISFSKGPKKAILQKKDGLFGFTPKFSDTHVNTLDWMTRRVPPVPWKWPWGSPEIWHSAFVCGGKRLSGHDLGIPVMVPPPETNKLTPDNWSVGVRWSLSFLGPEKTASFQGRFFAVSFQGGVNKLPFWLKYFVALPDSKTWTSCFLAAFKNDVFSKKWWKMWYDGMCSQISVALFFWESIVVFLHMYLQIGFRRQIHIHQRHSTLALPSPSSLDPWKERQTP